MRSRFARPARAALAAFLALSVLWGCGQSLRDVQNTLGSTLDRGDYGAAANVLSTPETQEIYEKRDSRLLLHLERGAAMLATGQDQAALDALDAAEALSSYTYNASDAAVLNRWVLNDEEAGYFAQPYEDQYVNVLKAVALLRMGKLQDESGRGAINEIKKANEKSVNLRNWYSQYVKDVERTDEHGFVGNAVTQRYQDQRGGEFVQSTLGAYLGALAAIKTGDVTNRDVWIKQLTDAAATQQTFVGQVPTELIGQLSSPEASEANVLVIAFSGRAPVKEAKQIEIPTARTPIKIPFPTLIRPVSSITAAELEVSEPGGPRRIARLGLVEDMGNVVAENYRRTEPAIYARTVVRIGLKLGVVAAASYGVGAGTGSSDWQAVTFWAGVAAIWATERADLRAWHMLPGQARVALVTLPPGEHQVRVRSLSGDRTVDESPWQTITAPATGGLTTIVTFTPR